MLKNKLKQLVSTVLTLLQIFTAFSCNATNIAPQNSKKVQLSAVKTAETVAKEESNESEMQSTEPKINESVNLEQDKLTPKDGEPTIIDQGTCGATPNDNVNWVLYSNGLLTISGSGAMTDYKFDQYAPWYANEKSLTSASIESGVTSIGVFSFSNCESLESVTISNSVTSIGAWAFNGCESLESLTIPNSVTSIGNQAFNCSALISITIPDSVTSIGRGIFFSCDALESVTIGNGITSIERDTFFSCDYLSSVTIPDSVTSIGDGAFSCCYYGLKSITIPDSVTSIGDEAFSYCRTLKSITIPDSVTSIGDEVFLGCELLKSVNFYGTQQPTDTGVNIFKECPTELKINVPTMYEGFEFCGKSISDADKNLFVYTIEYNGLEDAQIVANRERYNEFTSTFTLNNPTKNGYRFIGWTGSNGTTPQTTVTVPKGSTEDKTFTANWSKIYSITYDLAGGSLAPEESNPKEYITEEEIILKSPIRNGYRFMGWTGSNGTTPQMTVTIPKGSTEDKTFTANWSKIYSITYDLAGGSLASEESNPKEYITEEEITLKNPTRDGYDFAGWTGTGLNGETKNVTISKGSTGDRKYTANWKSTEKSNVGIYVGSTVGGLVVIAVITVVTIFTCKHFNIGPFRNKESSSIEI